ncbi:membrane-embedded CAAX protease MroQ-like [Hordeum vulgare subsp. vulgare]|nr:membrane-embedded CAAX protease MroQ-like [Hordeum vulgare subsp. vulgare]
MHPAHYPCAAPRRVASHLPFLPMDSPSAPPALLPGLRALPYGSSRRSLCPHSNQRLQRLPSPGASRRLVAAAAVDRLAPRRPEAGRLRWKYLLACRGPYDSGNGLAEPPPPPPSGESVDVWRPALRRWDVPWQWPTVSLTMVACALSSLLAGKVEQLVLEYLGYQAGEANIDVKAGVLFLEQLSVTAVAIGVMFGITNTFRPFSDDIFRYDLKEPFKLQNGWLLWAGIGLFFALVSIVLTGAAMSFLNGETTQRETDSLVLLLPLIGSSNISTACLLGITGVLAPILEETVFRGFLMVSLTMWFSTPVSVLITAVVFAFAHLTPGEFPQLFVLGLALGFSYSQTRNLITPITIHAVWNSGVILLLTVLQLQGYDIKELLQAS